MGQGFPRLDRVGGGAALVQRQGRAERRLLLCHQPVAGRRDPAAPSVRGLRVGGRGRLVSRLVAARTWSRPASPDR